jgi:hypothetical protein
VAFSDGIEVEMKPLSPFATFAPHLRKIGFGKTCQTTAGGERMDEWKREEPADDRGFARTLTVQIWAKGGHRVSHMVYSDPETRRLGRSTTYPTYFTTPDGLRAAVEHERTRCDNARYINERPG